MENYDEQIRELNRKRNEERENLAKELLPGYRKEWIGRCFKAPNSYGESYPDWWLYAKVTSVDQLNFSPMAAMNQISSAFSSKAAP
ncbi:hypothetical protein [Pseudodesulfovibrio senegalensis]|uniref:Uncharacterized protein n=1 Tax=Pseudodesulfovibrio senegalensis TaxID=1721087 RepID=A0A6N6MYC4_9BACT|nr:hypothetical protein [Pseudodesulfovibrio senegalensis]KAB1440354.1 hypothetical protein F8A88_13990 [Pseudodesulfovibrio senegalensis]